MIQHRDEFEKKLLCYGIDQLKEIQQLIGGFQEKMYKCRYKYQDYCRSCILKVVNYQYKYEVEKELQVYQKLKYHMSSNDNLVTIFNLIDMENLKQICILMEECDTDLQEYMKKQLNLKSILDFLHQFLNGYKPLYDQKVVHRDIKPENILISLKNNQPIYKLADFGVSKLCCQFGNHQSKIGTPLYSSPEQNKFVKTFQNDKILVDYERLSKADGFSLGLVLYELYFQKLPFQSQAEYVTYTELSYRERVEKLGRIKYEDQWFVNIVLFMITKLPNERLGFQDLYKCYDQDYQKFEINFKKLSNPILIAIQKSSQELKLNPGYLPPFVIQYEPPNGIKPINKDVSPQRITDASQKVLKQQFFQLNNNNIQQQQQQQKQQLQQQYQQQQKQQLQQQYQQQQKQQQQQQQQKQQQQQQQQQQQIKYCQKPINGNHQYSQQTSLSPLRNYLIPQQQKEKKNY